MKTMNIILVMILIINSMELKKREKNKEFLLPLLFGMFFLILNMNKAHPIMIKINIFFGLSGIMFILLQIKTQCKKKIPYSAPLIVLGCGLLEGKRISPMLMKRCDTAFEMHNCYGLKIIVCGGRGKDETISEAEAMKDYLIKKGMKQEEIQMEDNSINTKENLLFAYEKAQSSMNVISSDFHMMRVKIIARRLHLSIRCFSSKSAYYYKLYAYLREYLAFLWLNRFGWLVFLLILFFLL